MSGRWDFRVILMVIFETFHHMKGEDKIELRTPIQGHRFLVFLFGWRTYSMGLLDTILPPNLIFGKTRHFGIQAIACYNDRSVGVGKGMTKALQVYRRDEWSVFLRQGYRDE